MSESPSGALPGVALMLTIDVQGNVLMATVLRRHRTVDAQHECLHLTPFQTRANYILLQSLLPGLSTRSLQLSALHFSTCRETSGSLVHGVQYMPLPLTSDFRVVDMNFMA